MSSETEQMKSSLSGLLKNDSISVEMLPSKKGLLRKHIEYNVHSAKFKSKVVRRYSDFFALHEVLLWHYPYRLITPLPPQKLTAFVAAVDSPFAESRRRGLARWLKLISAHPVVSKDPAVQHFMTYIGDDHCTHIREHFRSLPDEFVCGTMSCFKGDLREASDLIEDGKTQVNVLTNTVAKLLAISDRSASFATKRCEDIEELGHELSTMGSENFQVRPGQSGQDWTTQQASFRGLSKELSTVITRWRDYATDHNKNVAETLKMLQAVLLGYRDLMDRGGSDKNLNWDHKRNAEKVLNIRQRKLSGVLSSDSNILEMVEKYMGTEEAAINELDNRRTFASKVVAEETKLVFTFAELLGEAIYGLWKVESEGLNKVSESWTRIASTIGPLKPKSSQQ